MNFARLNESQDINLTKLCDRLIQSASKTVAFFETKLKTDGSYGTEAKDIACYFKSPMLFIEADKPSVAIKILAHVQNFMMQDGDFSSADIIKSIRPEYAEYWTYINGWILRAANRLSFTGIAVPAGEYLAHYNIGNGFLTNNIQDATNITDILTASHHGLLNLEIRNLDIAISAGNYLCDALSKQPDIQKGFYLRFDKNADPIVEFKNEQAPFYFVSKTEPNQLHFMIGYSSAYLALLYKETSEEKFLTAAKEYLDFSLSCHESIYQCDFSHKIAWAASLVYGITAEARYLDGIEKITNYFIKTQSDEGIWYAQSDINTQYDQSAEIACWFLSIRKNLLGMKKKDDLKSSNIDRKSNICH